MLQPQIKAMSLRTEHLARCIETLEASLAQLRQAADGSIEYEIYRNAAVKGFELALETAGKLLRKAVKSYTGNPRAVDDLTYKEVLRHAGKHGLMDTAAVERWFRYRDNRNNKPSFGGGGSRSVGRSPGNNSLSRAAASASKLHAGFRRPE